VLPKHVAAVGFDVIHVFYRYGAETWSLYEDDRKRINATEMDALRRSTRISKLDRKTNEYIRGKWTRKI
jgi:hypothetical protein